MVNANKWHCTYSDVNFVWLKADYNKSDIMNDFFTYI